MAPGDPLKPFNELADLPPAVDIETPEILKQTIQTRASLAELKGSLQTLVNPSLLLNSVILREGQASSEIENIVTTQDEVFRAFTLDELKSKTSPELKEVLRYREAMWAGHEAMTTSSGLTTNVLIRIVQVLREVEVGIRKTPGTKLASRATGEVIYTPPEGYDLLVNKLNAVEKYIHREDHSVDPLIIASLMHYQFEAIHPFTDGNGRTGRIAIVLYLVQRELLQQPVLFLSGTLLKTRQEYYRLLRAVTYRQSWHEWILYFLNAIDQTAELTLNIVREITKLRATIHSEIDESLGSAMASQLSVLLHEYPYIKIGTLVDRGIVKRQTAAKYLSRLVNDGILQDEVRGRDRYFINHRLIDVLQQA